MNAAAETRKAISPVRTPLPPAARHSMIFGLTAAGVYGLALVKAIVITGAYGTGPEMDAFTMALLIPNLLATIAASNCGPAMVPVLASAARQGGSARGNAFRATLFLSLAASFVAAAALYGFAGPLVTLIAPRFDALRHAHTVELLRIASLLPVASVSFGYCSAELLSRRKYFLVAVTPGISLAVTIAAVLASAHKINALAYGVVVGTVIQAAIVMALSLRGSPVVETLRLWTPHVRAILIAQLPLIGAAAFGVANSSIDQALAALLPTGSASALNYAIALNALLIQSVAMSASWVALPEFSDLAAAGDLQRLRERARQYMVALTAIAAPLTAAVLLFGGTGIRLVFERRAFTAHSTLLVNGAWAGYALGLVPIAIGMVCVRILNALGANRSLMLVGLTMLPLNAALDLALMRIFGVFGIGLSTSLVMCCSAALLLTFAKRCAGTLLDGPTAGRLLGAVLASGLGGIACLGGRWFLGSSITATLISAAVMVLTIGVLYAGLGLLRPFATRSSRQLGAGAQLNATPEVPV